MQQDDITIFAQTNFRNQFKKFGIKRDDRRRHMYLVGKTGMGKSTMLENMIISDINANKGVAVIDPHGDLVEKIIQYIPNNRINDVIFFNPSDIEYPIAFNVVEKVQPEYRYLIASGLLGVFKKLWADSWGPRLEYILRNALLAILDFPDSTLLGVTRMLSDKSYRKKVIEKVQDPVVKSFWKVEFAGYADKFAAEAIAPIQNKVGQFLSSSLIRNIVGQVKSSIDLREIMDKGKILVLNLSKGRIGEDNSALLGAMMITKIQLAAMSRVDIPEEQRRDFYLYVDEFQNFATESFANILSEARKYRLNLIMAHQYIEQLDEKVMASVFGNVGTIISFRVGAMDAEELAKEFMPNFNEEDLINLPKYNIYLKLMIDGITSHAFSAVGLPPHREDEKTGNLEKIIKISRERYTKKREIVEDKINRWSQAIETKDKIKENKKIKTKKILSNEQTKDIKDEDYNKINKKQENKKNNLDIDKSQNNNLNNLKYEAICARCGAKTMVSFKPDGIRPVYCKNCLKEVKKEKELEIEERKKLKEIELRKIEQSKKKEIKLDEIDKQPILDFKENNYNKKTQKNLKKDVVLNEHNVKEIKPGEIIDIKHSN